MGRRTEKQAPPSGARPATAITQAPDANADDRQSEIRGTRKRGTVAVRLQLGKVTAISPTSVSLISEDSYAHSYVLTDRTKIKQKRAAVSLLEV